MKTITITDLQQTLLSNNPLDVNNYLNNIATTEIIDKLENIADLVAFDDIDYYLTEIQNVDGSWYCSNPAARQDLFENFESFAKIHQSYIDAFGDFENVNIFDDVESAHCLLLIHLVSETWRAFVNNSDLDFLSECTVLKATIANDVLTIEYNEQ